MLETIENSKPIPCGDDETELHTLTGKGDLDACLWALKSFLMHSGRRMPVVIHSDGTLAEAEVARLHRHLPGCEIIERSRAREELTTEFSRASFPFACHTPRTIGNGTGELR